MALELFNHESCSPSTKINSAYCAEMSTANNLQYTNYTLPSSVITNNNILSIYLAVANLAGSFDLIKVNSSDWTAQTGNKIQLNNQDPANMALHNRIIVIPNNAINLCFTGVANSNVSNKRPLWVKRSDTTKMYDYLSLTSIDYFHKYYSILEFATTQFANGIGTGFTNMTPEHTGMRVDFDGQYIGSINQVLSVNSIQLDTTFTSTGTSRSFVYAQGTLEFALDVNGNPSNWTRHLSLETIDHSMPVKFWIRDFKTVSSNVTVYANNAIRILGTEFIV